MTITHFILIFHIAHTISHLVETVQNGGIIGVSDIICEFAKVNFLEWKRYIHLNFATIFLLGGIFKFSGLERYFTISIRSIAENNIQIII